VEHWSCQVEAPKGAPDLGDWPGPLENDQGGRWFRMHSLAVLNVGYFDAETVHAGCLDKERLQ
jgi:hypothetical protein